ncbi:hypothetical protein [Desulfosporosinus fructosivorans]
MKRLLIVDDAAFMRIILKSIHEKNGFQVIGEAENARNRGMIDSRRSNDSNKVG